MTARLGALLFFIATMNYTPVVIAAEQITLPVNPITTQDPAPIREAMIVAPEPEPQVQPAANLPLEEEPIQIELTNLKGDYPEISALPDENVWHRIRSG
ncbi:MAG: hypothetical protein AAB278_03365, partial [Pseudomonadota bacterium]